MPSSAEGEPQVRFRARIQKNLRNFEIAV